MQDRTSVPDRRNPLATHGRTIHLGHKQTSRRWLRRWRAKLHGWVHREFSHTAGLRQGLRDLRWSEDRTLRIDYCWAVGDPNRLRACVAEMTVTPSDVILTISAQALRTVREATRSIPVVFLQVSDPVDGGFVDSMARPGGNITGFTNFEYSIGGKWLEVLKEIAPRVGRVLFMLNPKNAAWPGCFQAIESAASSFT